MARPEHQRPLILAAILFLLLLPAVHANPIISSVSYFLTPSAPYAGKYETLHIELTLNSSVPRNLTSIYLSERNATFLEGAEAVSCISASLWGLANNTTVTNVSMFRHSSAGFLGGSGIFYCDMSSPPEYRNGTALPESSWLFPLGSPVNSTAAGFTTYSLLENGTEIPLAQPFGYSGKYIFSISNFTYPLNESNYSVGLYAEFSDGNSTPEISLNFSSITPYAYARLSSQQARNLSKGGTYPFANISLSSTASPPYNATISRIIVNLSAPAEATLVEIVNSTSGSSISQNSTFGNSSVVVLSLPNLTVPAGMNASVRAGEVSNDTPFSSALNLTIRVRIAQNATSQAMTLSFSPQSGIEISNYYPAYGNRSPISVYSQASEYSHASNIANLSISRALSADAYGRSQTKPFNLTVTANGSDSISHLELAPASGFTILSVSGGNCSRNSTALATCFVNLTPSTSAEISVNATAPTTSGNHTWTILAFNRYGANCSAPSFNTTSQGPAAANVSIRTALPQNVTAGQTGVSAVFYVNNSGEAQAVLLPAAVANHTNSSSPAIPITSSLSSITVPGNGSVAVTVTLSVPSGAPAGNIMVYLNASGYDANTLSNISSAAASSVTTVLKGAYANATSLVPERTVAYTSRVTNLTLSVLNSGENSLSNLTVALAPAVSGFTAAVPVAPAVAAPGGFSNFTVSLSVGANVTPANYTLNFSVSGKDAATSVTSVSYISLAIPVENVYYVSISAGNLSSVEAGRGANFTLSAYTKDSSTLGWANFSFPGLTWGAVLGAASQALGGTSYPYNLQIVPYENATPVPANRTLSIILSGSDGSNSGSYNISIATIPRVVCGGASQVCCEGSNCNPGNICCAGTCRATSEGKCCAGIWKANVVCCIDPDCGAGNICALNNGTCIPKPYGEDDVNASLGEVQAKLDDLNARIEQAEKSGKDAGDVKTIIQAITLTMRQVRIASSEKNFEEAKRKIVGISELFAQAETTLSGAPDRPPVFVFVSIFLVIVLVGFGAAGYFYLQKGKAGGAVLKGTDKVVSAGMAAIAKEKAAAAKPGPVWPQLQRPAYPPSSFFQARQAQPGYGSWMSGTPQYPYPMPQYSQQQQTKAWAIPSSYPPKGAPGKK